MLPGLQLDRVHAYFRKHLAGVGERLDAKLIIGGRSNLTYVLSDGTQRWVLRRGPLGSVAASAHDMHREYTITRALSNSRVPVPTPIFHSEDSSITGAPFAVYEFVDGIVAQSSSDLDQWSDDQIVDLAHKLIDVLTCLHSIDVENIGLANLGKSQGYLERQIRRFGSQWDQFRTQDVESVDTLRSKLSHLCPKESGASLVHGDFRIDNAIFTRNEPISVCALVDWEMATLGDPLADLALHLVYRDSRFAPVLGDNPASADTRMPSANSLAQRYADRSGRSLDQLRFYLALSYFKAAIIADGIRRRYLEGHTVGPGFTDIGTVVPTLANAGLEVLD